MQSMLLGTSDTATGPVSRPDPTLTGFSHYFETVDGVRLHYVEGGKPDGETLVLLAGFPESWYAWRKVMPFLGAHYRVIAPDLPGQGDSDCPISGYDTSSMATAVHGLLGKLGARRYHVVAHDVGAWVAFPFAAMFGDEVQRLVLMDAGIPGVTLPEMLPYAPDRAWRTWHFSFHAVPDLPEMLIAGKEHVYLDWFLRRKAANPACFSEADIAEYVRTFTRMGALRAGLGYYRAAAESARQNKMLLEKGPLRMPVLALSADQGSIPDMAKPLRPYVDDVRGETIAHCGHFLPEEQPEAVVAALRRFLG